MGITREDYFARNGVADWIVHLCSHQAWEDALATGNYQAASLASEGFIHCSRPDQILAVANAFYHGLAGLSLLWIDPLLVTPEVRWEPVDKQVFPHLYGPLNLDAVAAELRPILLPPSSALVFLSSVVPEDA